MILQQFIEKYYSPRSIVLLILCIIAITGNPGTLSAKKPIRTIEGIVTSVTDGDTVQVKDADGTRVKIRLYGIDAPETEKKNRKTGRISKRGQPWGREAWKALEKKVLRKKVKVDVMDRDRYKRLVCIIWLDGRNINREMVSEGHAWAYKQYLKKSPYASEFIREEGQAREKKLGIWKEPNPQPPWEFRHRKGKGR